MKQNSVSTPAAADKDKDSMFDVKSYNDKELYQILDLDNPTDRELEAKINQLLVKYENMKNPMGETWYAFINDIYHHFFEFEDDDQDQDHAKDQHEETVTEGFTSGQKDTSVQSTPKPASTPTPTALVPTSSPVVYQKTLDYTKGTLNPILKETITRTISIDSQFRDINSYPYTTDFTFNLSETLHDVVSVKLYSVQIPYTWYTISSGFGSNFFYLKGNSPGITYSNFEHQIIIPSGNYQITDITNAIRTSFKQIFAANPDVNFGKTDICYNSVNGCGTLVIDIQNIYNEYYYQLTFPPVIETQIPLYIGFNSNLYINFTCFTFDVSNDVLAFLKESYLNNSNYQNTTQMVNSIIAQLQTNWSWIGDVANLTQSTLKRLGRLSQAELNVLDNSYVKTLINPIGHFTPQEVYTITHLRPTDMTVLSYIPQSTINTIGAIMSEYSYIDWGQFSQISQIPPPNNFTWSDIYHLYQDISLSVFYNVNNDQLNLLNNISADISLVQFGTLTNDISLSFLEQMYYISQDPSYNDPFLSYLSYMINNSSFSVMRTFTNAEILLPTTLSTLTNAPPPLYNSYDLDVSSQLTLLSQLTEAQTNNLKDVSSTILYEMSQLSSSQLQELSRLTFITPPQPSTISNLANIISTSYTLYMELLNLTTFQLTGILNTSSLGLSAINKLNPDILYDLSNNITLPQKQMLYAMTQSIFNIINTKFLQINASQTTITWSQTYDALTNYLMPRLTQLTPTDIGNISLYQITLLTILNTTNICVFTFDQLQQLATITLNPQNVQSQALNYLAEAVTTLPDVSNAQLFALPTPTLQNISRLSSLTPTQIQNFNGLVSDISLSIFSGITPTVLPRVLRDIGSMTTDTMQLVAAASTNYALQLQLNAIEADLLVQFTPGQLSILATLPQNLLTLLGQLNASTIVAWNTLTPLQQSVVLELLNTPIQLLPSNQNANATYILSLTSLSQSDVALLSQLSYPQFSTVSSLNTTFLNVITSPYDLFSKLYALFAYPVPATLNNLLILQNLLSPTNNNPLLSYIVNSYRGTPSTYSTFVSLMQTLTTVTFSWNNLTTLTPAQWSELFSNVNYAYFVNMTANQLSLLDGYSVTTATFTNLNQLSNNQRNDLQNIIAQDTSLNLYATIYTNLSPTQYNVICGLSPDTLLTLSSLSTSQYNTLASLNNTQLKQLGSFQTNNTTGVIPPTFFSYLSRLGPNLIQKINLLNANDIHTIGLLDNITGTINDVSLSILYPITQANLNSITDVSLSDLNLMINITEHLCDVGFANTINDISLSTLLTLTPPMYQILTHLTTAELTSLSNVAHDVSLSVFCKLTQDLSFNNCISFINNVPLNTFTSLAHDISLSLLGNMNTTELQQLSKITPTEIQQLSQLDTIVNLQSFIKNLNSTTILKFNPAYDTSMMIPPPLLNSYIMTDVSYYGYTASDFINILNADFSNNSILYNSYATLDTSNNLNFEFITDNSSHFYVINYYDSIWYPQNSSTALWTTQTNVWYKSIHISDPSYLLINNTAQYTTQIQSSQPLIQEPTSTNKLSNTYNTLQEMFGYTNNNYAMNCYYSNPFFGNIYKNNLIFPNLDLSTNYVNASVHFILYATNVHNVNPYFAYSASNRTYTDSYMDISNALNNNNTISLNLGYANVNQSYIYFSYADVINYLNKSITDANIFTSDSRLWVVDASGNDVSDIGSTVRTASQTAAIQGIQSIQDTERYRFKLTLKLNRKTVYRTIPNTSNMKCVIQLLDPIWTNMLFFPDISSSYIELSDIQSETSIATNTIFFNSNPYIYLRCITPGYTGNAVNYSNDISFSIQPPGPNGYSNAAYIHAWNTSIASTSLIRWGLTGRVFTDASGFLANIDININRTIPPAINGLPNFIIDFSGTYLRQLTADPLVFSSNTSTYTFYLPQVPATFDIGNQNTIVLSSLPPYQDISSTILLPRTSILQGGDSIATFINKINTDISNAILNTGVSLFGSNMNYDANTSTITFTFVANKTLTYQDYQLEFYDPSGYVQAVNQPPTTNTTRIVTTYDASGSIYFVDRSNHVHQDSNRHLSYQDGSYVCFSDPSGYVLYDYSNNQAQLYDNSNHFLDTYPGNATITNTGTTTYTTEIQNGVPQYFVAYNDGTPIQTDTQFHTWNNPYNTWYNYMHIAHPTYVLSEVSYNNVDGSVITSSVPVSDKTILINEQNNFFTLQPVSDLSNGVYISVNVGAPRDPTNDIVIKLSNLQLNHTYLINDVMNEINLQLTNYSNQHGNTTKGSWIYTDPNTNHTILRINVNTIYTTQDYVLDFFDPVSFTHCNFGFPSSIQPVTWDTTLGWLLGFRSQQIYHLTYANMTVSKLNNTVLKYYQTYTRNVYTYDPSTNICSLTGDTAINVNLYNYLMLVLDDYSQSHLNDGLITITSSSLDVPVNSYSSRNMALRCNQSGTSSTTTQSSYIGNTPDPVTGNNMTANQVYSANQILNQQRNIVQNPYQSSLGPLIQDIFGIIPLKVSGLQVGQSFIEYGGTLQMQDRVYFGPVNISRMSVKLLTDKGTILDLNNTNWSFSLVIQQLYNPNKG